MIQFLCPNCKHKLRAPVDAAGRIAKCRKCESKVRIPSPPPKSRATQPQAQSRAEPKAEPTPGPAIGTASESPTTSRKSSRRQEPCDRLLTQIREQFDGKVPRNHLNLPYQFSLALVALLMILLPLLYVGLIAAACYGMCWYWTDILSPGISNLPRGRAGLFAMLAMISPLIGGSIMILFMIKPIFFVFVRPRENRRRSLKRATEPVLFELVDRICEATRSPKPKRIDIDNDVNASASLRRGLLSLFGKDLVLTIGAPLIAGMNTRQLTGVLAHEFGHFAQGGGMKTTYVIRSINAWFARVVYQRDQLDQMLEDGISESDYRIALILMLSKVFVVASRAILWCFMFYRNQLGMLVDPNKLNRAELSS